MRRQRSFSRRDVPSSASRSAVRKYGHHSVSPRIPRGGTVEPVVSDVVCPGRLLESGSHSRQPQHPFILVKEWKLTCLILLKTTPNCP